MRQGRITLFIYHKESTMSTIKIDALWNRIRVLIKSEINLKTTLTNSKFSCFFLAVLPKREQPLHMHILTFFPFTKKKKKKLIQKRCIKWTLANPSYFGYFAYSIHKLEAMVQWRKRWFAVSSHRWQITHHEAKDTSLGTSQALQNLQSYPR